MRKTQTEGLKSVIPEFESINTGQAKLYTPSAKRGSTFMGLSQIT